LTVMLSVLSCSEDRGTLLKVYNWGDYIDEDLISEFEQWYLEQTGEEVSVVYQTFDINETMLSKIEKGHEDYDIVCPSDYIIERMLRADLVLPIDASLLGDTPNYMYDNLAPIIKKFLSMVDGYGKDANDYTVPYMWGTTGFTYNQRYVSPEDVSTWNVIKDDRFIDKIFIKDAPRDVYSAVIQYLLRDEIAAGTVNRDSLMLDTSDENVALFEEYMSDMRHRVAGWEADFGKEQMTQERGWISLAWSGDAVWAVMEARETGVPLDYAVPMDGSNVWFDGWVIPKYARNVKAATFFINFLCRPDVAVRNMDYIGYVSAVASSEVLEAMSDEEAYPQTVDASYFFGEQALQAHLNPSMYPDRSVIDRCALMHDWGTDADKLISMWARVKGNQMSSWTIFVIAITVLLIAAVKIQKFILKRKHSIRRQRHISGHAERSAKAS